MLYGCLKNTKVLSNQRIIIMLLEQIKSMSVFQMFSIYLYTWNVGRN